MAAREDLIVDAVMEALRRANIDGVLDRVYERRGMSISVHDLPAVDVTRQSGTLEVLDLYEGGMAHELRLSIDVVVAEPIGAAPDRQASALAAQVHRALMTDETIAGLVRAVTPGPFSYLSQQTGDGVILRRAAEFTFDHVTAVDDLESAP
jgi:hypothetical protein